MTMRSDALENALMSDDLRLAGAGWMTREAVVAPDAAAPGAALRDAAPDDVPLRVGSMV
ncbi:MAG TPA: hypothetical protein VII35_07610 [Steroidobacteraceae bacterium]